MTIALSEKAVVQVPWSDFRRLEEELEGLRVEVARLRDGAPTAPPIGGDHANAIAALEAALPIVQFAVGNLNPESTRDWPFDALRSLADQIEIVYADNPDRRSLAIEMRVFAREAEEIEIFRAQRYEGARTIVGPESEETVKTESESA